MLALGILSRLPWRTIGLALAVVGLLLGARHAWNARYDNGVKAGRAAVEAEYAEAERRRLAADLARRNEAETRHAREQSRIDATNQAITEKVSAYARTTDCAAVCLPADSVQAILDNRASLFPPAAAAGDDGVQTVPHP